MPARLRHAAVSAAVGTLVAAIAWWSLLGWDTSFDHNAAGDRTGPYEAWQVILLLVVLLGVAVWLGARRSWVISPLLVAFVLAVCNGVSFHTYSDTSDGLWIVGVLFTFIGTWVGVTAVAALTMGLTTWREGGRASRRSRSGGAGGSGR